MVASEIQSRWVVEAQVDFPVLLPSRTGTTLSTLSIPIHGNRPDGFVQLKPKDGLDPTAVRWWSKSEQSLFDCRVLVTAANGIFALTQGMELLERLADRLAFYCGRHAEVVSIGFAYDEDSLKACIAGTRTEFDATSGGEPCFRVEEAKNSHLPQLLMPPEQANDACRWFRLGMSATRTLDQYLYYYIALESIAESVPNVTAGPRRDAAGTECGGLESQQAAAIKMLLQLRGLTPDRRQELASIRARIAHGATDTRTFERARANVSLVQRVAADGIALVCGVPPTALQVLAPTPELFVAPMLSAHFDAADNPSTRWNGLLSDAFARRFAGT